MEYEIRLHRSVRKNVERMPERIHERFDLLLDTLRHEGPTGPHHWRNYGKLRGKENEYHCHLSANHGYVVCWKFEKETIIIEVYYVGSHQSAPY